MPRRKADYAEDEIREEEIEEVEKEAPVLIPYKRKIANFDKKPYIQIEGYPVLKERDIQKMHDDAAIELYRKLFGKAAGANEAKAEIVKIIMGE
jgi:hypothetical protein